MTDHEHPLLPRRRASAAEALSADLALRDTLGRPLRDLRISVMDRCNFRCPYCMPQHTFHDGYRFLASAERLSFEEIVRLARLGARIGVRKLRLTGGEPLLRPNLPDLIGDLSGLTGIEDVALTTNGILLAKYATELKAAGLHRVTVSLDSLDPAVFARLSGGFGGVDQVLEGIDAARRAGLGPVKVNAVIQRGINDHTALDLVERFRGTGVIVRFIEYMDVGNRNDWRAELVVPSAELAATISARWPLVPVHRNYAGEVAERQAFADGAGEVGFISSVSQPFCGDCSRARLSSDGMLYSCLFATRGVDLRGPLRAGADDDALTDLLRGTWARRADRYSEQRARQRADGGPKVEMFHVGG
jgi:cyclic pyranopterin phosphate synthase